MKTLLIAVNRKGVERLLERAEAALCEGEALVKITDYVSADRATVTVPEDPAAEVVARETPLVLPAGVTALTSYVRVRTTRLAALEFEVRGEEVRLTGERTLRPERVGRA